MNLHEVNEFLIPIMDSSVPCQGETYHYIYGKGSYLFISAGYDEDEDCDVLIYYISHYSSNPINSGAPSKYFDPEIKTLPLSTLSSNDLLNLISDYRYIYNQE